MHTGVLDPARNRIAAQPFAAILFGRVQAFRPLATDLGHPMQRLDIMHQGRAVEDANLRHKRRAMPRQPALALDAFDHRAFFAADISPRAAPQIDVAGRDQFGLFQRPDLARQNFQHRRIFVAHIDETGFRLDRPGGDQHAFQKQMRGAFQIIAILESTGLALVPVHGQIAHTLIGAHKSPFAPRRKACPTKPAQPAFQHLFLNRFPIAIGAQVFQRLIAAHGVIGCKILVIRHMRMGVICRNRGLHQFRRGVVNMVMPDLQHRSRIAPPHARRAQHAHFRGVQAILQSLLQLRRPGQFAAK